MLNPALTTLDLSTAVLNMVILAGGVGMHAWAKRHALPVYRGLFVTLAGFSLFYALWYPVLAFTDVAPASWQSVSRGVAITYQLVVAYLLPWTAVRSRRLIRDQVRHDVRVELLSVASDVLDVLDGDASISRDDLLALIGSLDQQGQP